MHPSFRLRLSVIALVAAGVAFAAAPAHALGLPPLVVSDPASADAWLDAAEGALAVGASPEPEPTPDETERRIRRLVRVMDKHWRDLDEACDPAAVFALTYLYTTEVIGDYVLAGYFDDGNHTAVIQVAFAALYFASFDAVASGAPGDASKPWREAFEAGAAGRTSVLEDVFLGMNAHINYNLGVVMEATGLHDAEGRSRKPDHDRINDVLAVIVEPLSQMLADHYDPSLAPGPESALTDPAVLHLIYSWREHAWRQAEAISLLPTAEQRALHDAALQEAAYLIALGIQSPKLGSTAPARIAYCEANPQ